MVILLVLLSLLAVAPAAAQIDDQPVLAVPTPAPGPTPIPISEIPTRAASTLETMRDVDSGISSDERLTQIRQALPAEQERVAELSRQTDERLQAPGRASAIKEAEKSTLRVRDRLDRWMGDLTTRSSQLEATLTQLQTERSLWVLTRDQERDGELPDSLREQISEVLEAILGSEQSVRAARDTVLALQADIAQEQGVLNSMLARQRAEIAQRAAGILRVDSPPLWRVFAAADDEQPDTLEQIEDLAKGQLEDLRGYVAERGAPLLVWVLLWAGLAASLILMRRRAKVWVQHDPSLQTEVDILGRPITGAAIIVLVLSYIVEAQAPTAWIDVVNLLLLLTLLLLLLGVLAKGLRAIAYLLIPLFVLLRAVELFPVASISHRLVLLALSLTGIGCCAWFLRAVRGVPGLLPDARMRWVRRGVRLAILLLAVGLLANLTGAVRFAALLVAGTVDAIFTAIILAVVGALLRSTIRIALISNTSRRMGIAPEHSDSVRRSFFSTVSLVVTIVWIVFALKGFTLYDQLVAKLGAILAAEASIGEFSISLGSVLIFVFVIWISIKLAALVDFVLDVIVLQHVTLPVGVPQTISRLSRYTVIVVGVLVAFSAIGFDVSKAALVAGGLGVGIGFGLQNIVNNFVSGLILLFERPIRVGDTIELGATSGVVEKIGLRATLIRTWRGPELVVPNADLVSSSVLNWTLMRDRRRIEISGRRRLRQRTRSRGEAPCRGGGRPPRDPGAPGAGVPLPGLRRQLARLPAARLGGRSKLRAHREHVAIRDATRPERRRNRDPLSAAGPPPQVHGLGKSGRKPR